MVQPNARGEKAVLDKRARWVEFEKYGFHFVTFRIPGKVLKSRATINPRPGGPTRHLPFCTLIISRSYFNTPLLTAYFSIKPQESVTSTGAAQTSRNPVSCPISNCHLIPISLEIQARVLIFWFFPLALFLGLGFLPWLLVRSHERKSCDVRRRRYGSTVDSARPFFSVSLRNFHQCLKNFCSLLADEIEEEDEREVRDAEAVDDDDEEEGRGLSHALAFVECFLFPSSSF